MSDDIPNRLPYWPAALNHKMAAAYCGLSIDVFKQVCPVKPIAFTSSSRGERYLRQRLDEWLLSIDPNKQNAAPTRRKIGDKLYGDRGEKRKLEGK